MPGRLTSFSPPRSHSSRLKSWFNKLSSRSSALNKVPHPQIDSRLLTILPLEIRLQIYAHVVASYGTVQHIHLTNNRLTHMRCVSPTPHLFFQTYGWSNDTCRTHDPDYRESVKNGWEIVPLLLSCRHVYLEFIESIYSSITFRLTIHAASQFIATVPGPYVAPAHLHILYTVLNPMYHPPITYAPELETANIDTKADEKVWESFWHILARLRVRVLVVEIFDFGVRVPEQILLKPLKNVSAEKFEVVLPWPKGLETSGELDDVGFMVRRPPEGTDLMREIHVDKGNPGARKRPAILGRLRRR